MNFETIKSLTPGSMLYMIDKTSLHLASIKVEMIHKKRGILASDAGDNTKFFSITELSKFYVISQDSIRYHQVAGIVRYLHAKKDAVKNAENDLAKATSLLVNFTNEVQQRKLVHFHNGNLVNISDPEELKLFKWKCVDTGLCDETTIFKISSMYNEDKKAPLTKEQDVFSLADDIVKDSNKYELTTFVDSKKISFEYRFPSSALSLYTPSKEKGEYSIFDNVTLDINDGSVYVVTDVKTPEDESGGYYCTLINRRALFYRREKDDHLPFDVHSSVMSHYDEDAEPTVSATANIS